MCSDLVKYKLLSPLTFQLSPPTTESVNYGVQTWPAPLITSLPTTAPQVGNLELIILNQLVTEQRPCEVTSDIVLHCAVSSRVDISLIQKIRNE